MTLLGVFVLSVGGYWFGNKFYAISITSYFKTHQWFEQHMCKLLLLVE